MFYTFGSFYKYILIEGFTKRNLLTNSAIKYTIVVAKIKRLLLKKIIRHKL